MSEHTTTTPTPDPTGPAFTGGPTMTTGRPRSRWTAAEVAAFPVGTRVDLAPGITARLTSDPVTAVPGWTVFEDGRPGIRVPSIDAADVRGVYLPADRRPPAHTPDAATRAERDEPPAPLTMDEPVFDIVEDGPPALSVGGVFAAARMLAARYGMPVVTHSGRPLADLLNETARNAVTTDRLPVPADAARHAYAYLTADDALPDPADPLDVPDPSTLARETARSPFARVTPAAVSRALAEPTPDWSDVVPHAAPGSAYATRYETPDETPAAPITGPHDSQLAPTTTLFHAPPLDRDSHWWDHLPTLSVAPGERVTIGFDGCAAPGPLAVVVTPTRDAEAAARDADDALEEAAERLADAAAADALRDLAAELAGDEPDNECLIGDTEWHPTFADTGYPCCVRCQTHHRHPETCADDEHDEAPQSGLLDALLADPAEALAFGIAMLPAPVVAAALPLLDAALDLLDTFTGTDDEPAADDPTPGDGPCYGGGEWPVDDLLAARNTLVGWARQTGAIAPGETLVIDVRPVPRLTDRERGVFGLPPRSVVTIHLPQAADDAPGETPAEPEPAATDDDPPMTAAQHADVLRDRLTDLLGHRPRYANPSTDWERAEAARAIDAWDRACATADGEPTPALDALHAKADRWHANNLAGHLRYALDHPDVLRALPPGRRFAATQDLTAWESLRAMRESTDAPELRPGDLSRMSVEAMVNRSAERAGGRP